MPARKLTLVQVAHWASLPTPLLEEFRSHDLYDLRVLLGVRVVDDKYPSHLYLGSGLYLNRDLVA